MCYGNIFFISKGLGGKSWDSDLFPKITQGIYSVSYSLEIRDNAIQYSLGFVWLC